MAIKIIDDTGKSKGPYISVKKAEYVDDYRLRLTFNDGKIRVVDFGKFLRKCPHPAFKKYLDIKRFKKFYIDYGHLMWGDHDLIFPMSDMYDGKIFYTPPNLKSLYPKSELPRMKVQLSLPTRIVRNLKSRAKKDGIDLDKLIRRYIDEGLTKKQMAKS